MLTEQKKQSSFWGTEVRLRVFADTGYQAPLLKFTSHRENKRRDNGEEEENVTTASEYMELLKSVSPPEFLIRESINHPPNFLIPPLKC